MRGQTWGSAAESGSAAAPRTGKGPKILLRVRQTEQLRAEADRRAFASCLVSTQRSTTSRLEGIFQIAVNASASARGAAVAFVLFFNPPFSFSPF